MGNFFISKSCDIVSNALFKSKNNEKAGILLFKFLVIIIRNLKTASIVPCLFKKFILKLS